MTGKNLENWVNLSDFDESVANEGRMCYIILRYSKPQFATGILPDQVGQTLNRPYNTIVSVSRLALRVALVVLRRIWFTIAHITKGK